MHTLYAIPFTCSLSVHLTLVELGLAHDIVWMTRFDHLLPGGADYRTVNPKDRVPALCLPDGELLTEMSALMAALDRAHVDRPDALRRRLAEWLGYIATELHSGVMRVLFDPRFPAETRRDMLERLLPPVLDHLDQRLRAVPTLLGGEERSVADHYLLWATILLKHSYPDSLAGREGLLNFLARGMARPATKLVLADERARL